MYLLVPYDQYPYAALVKVTDTIMRDNKLYYAYMTSTRVEVPTTSRDILTVADSEYISMKSRLDNLTNLHNEIISKVNQGFINALPDEVIKINKSYRGDWLKKDE